MLKEETVELSFGDFTRTYVLKQLSLGPSQEVLVRLLKLFGGEGLDEDALKTLPGRLRVEDINFLRERLLGEHCLYINENDKHVPMGKALVESHFAGRLGLLMHLLVRAVIHNFSDFLADLRLDELTGASEAQ